MKDRGLMGTISSPYEKLERILNLEREQGCQNRAVIGGLERFLRYWEKEAREETKRRRPPLSVDTVVEKLQGYVSFSVEKRRQVIEEILALLRAEAESSLPKSDGRRVASVPSPQKGERAGRQPQAQEGGLDSPVSVLRGVSEVNAKRLARLGIETVQDLLYHLPRRYDDFGRLKPINRLQWGDEVTIVGVVRDVTFQRTSTGKTIVRVTLRDATGAVEARWFNQPYLKQRFKVGSELVISGKVDEYLGRLFFSSPQWEPLQRELLHTGRLVPVYPLTEGLSARQFRRWVKQALDHWLPQLQDPLPVPIREEAGLVDLQTALRQIHFPDDRSSLEQARRRLSFDELFILQMGVLWQRRVWRSFRGRALYIPQEEVDEFIQRLPFELTGAQRRAIQDILADLQQPVPMSRLLQGDVGSGKTVVALVAMFVAVRNGLQA
ncbi:MAG: DNA helicase RecG, partial [Anaerolineae bacterium]|nr:DNA helicase RecG [Anaerolineae bacterium]